MSITTDGASAMVGHVNGLLPSTGRTMLFQTSGITIAKSTNKRYALKAQYERDHGCGNEDCLKQRRSIRARPLQRRLFPAHLEKVDRDHSELLLHTDVRWLSRGKFLQRFRELWPEIKEVFLYSWTSRIREMK